MKKTCLIVMFLAVMLGMSVSAFADAYTIGTGTSNQSYIPFYGLYDYGWSKTIYTQAEMQAAGVPLGTTITGVSYYVGNAPVNYVSVDQRIYVRHTNATAIDATYIADPLAVSPAFTQVWMGDLTWNGSGWHNVLFSMPFTWNGTDNLEILWYNWDGAYASGPNFRYTSTTPNYLACYKYSDGAMPTTNGTTTYNRPNIRILDALVSPPGPPALLAPIDTAIDVIPGPTFSWSAPTTGGVPTGYKLYLNPLSNDFTGVTPILVPGTSYVHPATLPFSTLYYWKVAATNSGGDTDSAVWSFTTMADPTINVFPHTEGFEGGVTLPFGWTRTATGTPSYNWEVVTTDAAHGAAAPFSGTYFARLYVYLASTSYNPYSLVSPPIDLSTGNKRLSYYAWVGAAGAPSPLDVEISIDGQATWIPLYSYSTAVDPTNAWTQNTIALDAYTASNAYIRFKATSNYGGGFCDLGLDEIVLEDIPNAPNFVINPDTYAFGPVFLNTMVSQTFTVSNTGGGSLSIVSIEKTAGDTGNFQITNNSYTGPLGPGGFFTFNVEFTATAETDYTVTVTVTDDQTKTPHDIIITGTGFDPTVDTLPWIVDFTNVLGWTQTGHWGLSDSAYAGGTAPEAVCYWSPGETGQFRLISPPVNICGTGNFTLSFKHFLDYYSVPAIFRVQISSDLENWTDIWTLVDPVANVGPETVTVPFAAAGQYYLAWVFDGDTYNIDYWYVDDITLDGTCTVPVELSSFTATLTAQNYVTLNWVSQSESQMVGYLVYRNSTNDPATATLIDSPLIPATNTSTTQTYSATDVNVEIGSTYFYWLEAVDYSSSAYHGPVSVTVEGNIPPVLPEITSMRNAYPNPFKANTNIEVGLKAGETGTVTIYNISGQVVRSYTVGEGYHSLNWNGRDAKGQTCGSGIYFYRLNTPSVNQTRKLVLAK